MKMRNVHPNAPVKVPYFCRRPTHKQSIALETATDGQRYSRKYWWASTLGIRIRDILFGYS